jgi:hypothetical protein
MALLFSKPGKVEQYHFKVDKRKGGIFLSMGPQWAPMIPFLSAAVYFS